MTAREDLIAAGAVYDWITGEVFTVADINDVRFTRDASPRDNWLFRFDKSERPVETLVNVGDYVEEASN